ncbi:MAG: hypothetical protein K2X93_05785 [Candidatus Obscuribacterales bacterium]|nr:hypothetical protein [Candidatus Obscuribacterales bacterium]
MEQASDRAGANSPEISSDVTKPRVVRVIRSDVGKGQYFEAFPNQEITIGPELDLNVGGRDAGGPTLLHAVH